MSSSRLASAMATAQVVTAQARSVRAATNWPPPSSGLMYTRPWRSSPLAGPAFSTLPPVIPECAEEHQEDELAGREGACELPRTRSPSIVSQTGSLSTLSGDGSRDASGSASALVLAEGEASTSSVSLVATSTAAHGTSSQGHASSQSHSNRPTRLTKSWSRRTSVDPAPPKNITRDVSITPPPRARTHSHGHSRSATFSVQPLVPSSTIPQAYSRSSPRRPRTSPEPGSDNAKQPPSKSRDPDSNWMSSSPFGPAQTPKFSRLAMASPAVVMPLSAREYRKQKAKESVGKGKEESPTPADSVAIIDNALSAFQSPNGVPLVKVSPPSLDIQRPPSPANDHSPDRRSGPQPPPSLPLSKPPPQASMSPRPSSPKQRRPRSRPNTPPRSSPLASHPPISPKSSAGTFFSFVSNSDDDSFRPPGANAHSPDNTNATNPIPPARPRPRPRRRKSYPDRLSNGARLSLLEAMNRLSQEGASPQRLSGISQTDGANRLSVMSQASGHTLFYDAGESVGERDQVTCGHEDMNDNAGETAPRTSVLHTQSLEDLSSTLARSGIEVVRADGPLGAPSDEERKAKRNVRTVRISDTVEVSPLPVHRPRKLTKSRLGSARGSVSGVGPGSEPGTETIKETKVQTQTKTPTQERRTSLLPWKSKGPSDSKVATGSPALGEKDSHPPIANGSVHVESPSKFKFNNPSKKTSSDAPVPTPTPMSTPVASPELQPSTPTTPSKSRRYTFSFLSTPTFHRPKPNTAPASADPALDHNTKGRFEKGVIGVERSGTNSTSTSIRTIAPGSQSSLVPTYDLTTLASSGGLSGSGQGTKSSVPMLRRLNAQEMVVPGVPSQGEWESKGASTPSLITNGSTATTSSSPRTPSFYRTSGGDVFVPRPSGLKESYADTLEEDPEDPFSSGRTSRLCMHRKQESSPLACASVGWGETLEEDEQHLRPSTSPRPGSRPGTSDSTLTTATSGSYRSFSTIPASTASSVSTSRSESPPPVIGDEKDQVLSVQGGDGEDTHTCTLCGHRSASSSPLRSLSPSPMGDPDPPGMHPMFTVPLVTIPASALDMCSRSRSNMPSGMQVEDTGTHGTRQGWRKSEQHTSAPVPAAAAGVNVILTPTRPTRYPNHTPVNASRDPVAMSMPTKAKTMGMDDRMIATTMTTPSPSPVPPPHKVKKRSRPQTAPAGTGDAALKFIEEAKAMRAREGGVDIDTLIRGDRATKHKAGSKESKFKVMLKGLLKWGA